MPEAPWGPCLAALIVIPFGQASIGWFALAALLANLHPRKDRELVQTATGFGGPQTRRCGGYHGTRTLET